MSISTQLEDTVRLLGPWRIYIFPQNISCVLASRCRALAHWTAYLCRTVNTIERAKRHTVGSIAHQSLECQTKATRHSTFSQTTELHLDVSSRHRTRERESVGRAVTCVSVIAVAQWIINLTGLLCRIQGLHLGSWFSTVGLGKLKLALVQ